MPSQRISGSQSLLSKLGDKGRQAWAQVKDTEVEFSKFSDLPAGISGIAQLQDCKFEEIPAGQMNAGMLRFQAVGIIVYPTTFKGMKIQGLQTRIFEPIYDTPNKSRKTIKDHLNWIKDFLGNMGMTPSEIDFEDLEGSVKALMEAGPHFKFRTWQGAKDEIVEKGGKWFIYRKGVQTKGPYLSEAALKTANKYAGEEPMVSQSWEGACEWTPPDDQVDDNGVQESPPPSTNGSASRGTTSRGGKMSRAEMQEPVDETPADDLEFGDLDSLAAAAEDDPDLEAQKLAQARLREMALEQGFTDDDVDNAENWEAVAQMVRGAGEGGEANEGEDTPTDEEPEAEEYVPEVEQVILYRVMDPKTKKPAKKGTECEILTVDPKTETVTLKNLDVGATVMDPKTKKPLKVKWSDLEQGS